MTSLPRPGQAQSCCGKVGDCHVGVLAKEARVLTRDFEALVVSMTEDVGEWCGSASCFCFGSPTLGAASEAVGCLGSLRAVIRR